MIQPDCLYFSFLEGKLRTNQTDYQFRLNKLRTYAKIPMMAYANADPEILYFLQNGLRKF